MRARTSILSLVLVLALVLVAGAATWAASRERAIEPAWDERPPNVLLISIDTLRADHMGLYGYERPTTPRIDEWAEEAVVFENAQASASWTLPGLASIMTSYFSSTHGCWTFQSRLDPSFPTLAEIMTGAGYDSAAVTSHIFLARRYGLQQGFVHFDDEFAHPVMDPTQAVTSDHVSDRGIRFLRQKAEAGHDDVPWLLWLHYFDPHGAYMPHEGISEQFGTEREIDLYDGEIRFTDLHVGRLFDALEETGMAEDTIVVVFSDHGEEFEDHGGLRHGHTLHRELVRVPFAISAPGVAPRRVERAVRTVDLMPTLLELVDLPAPEGIEGVSLAQVLSGGEPRELPALAEIRLAEDSSFDSVQQGRWKLIVNVDTAETNLYDVEADPLETEDVAAENPEVVDELKALLVKMIRRAQAAADRFERGQDLGLSETQLEHMRGLGYLGN